MIEPWYSDDDATLYLGDAAEQLAALPPASAQCLVTSPPFWNLRDYGVEGQIGVEATPEEWVERLVAVMREAKRVLAPDGVCWIEVGDTYATKPNNNAYHGKGVDTSGLAGGGDYQAAARALGETGPPPGCKAKDLVGAPWLLAFALRADGWYLRSDTIWARPNPMPESVTDRPTKAHSYVFLLTKSARYYYDADAISEPVLPDSIARADRGSRYDDPLVRASVPYAAPRPRVKKRTVREGVDTNGGGQGSGSMTWGDRANARSVWTIPTESTAFDHYAVMPMRLATKCILAGSRPGDAILDPFMGSGTTALSARRCGRRSIGIELNEASLAIAADRLAQQGIGA